MPEEQFAFLRELLAAPSPVGMEGAMTRGVLEPRLREILPSSWELHRFRGNAGLVADSAPDRDDLLKVMVIGHADQIRMQVRSIGPDGKIWINSDSFLPITLIGHAVRLFSEDPDAPGRYRTLSGGTIEAIGAIHFTGSEYRNGRKGIKPLDRPIRRGFGPDSYYGAYLDNGLGCFVAAESARLLAESGGLEKVRYLAAFASHEEIGRMGSRVLAQELEPDVVIGVDVSHDFEAAPNIGEKRMEPVKMGGGPSLSFGAICSAQLNSMILEAAKENDIPVQPKSAGRDTGTDAMAAVFAGIDAAATSMGVPIRNMHTISETGHTGDLLAATHLVAKAVQLLDARGVTADDFRRGHPNLAESAPIEWRPVETEEE